MPRFWSVLLYDQPFSVHRVVKNRKLRNALNDLKMTLNTYNSQKYLAYSPAVFQVQGCQNRKNWNATNDPRLTLKS